eukprot:gene7825-1402_t
MVPPGYFEPMCELGSDSEERRFENLGTGVDRIDLPRHGPVGGGDDWARKWVSVGDHPKNPKRAGAYLTIQSKESGAPPLVIPLEKVISVVALIAGDDAINNTYEFMLSLPKKVHVLRSSSQGERDYWVAGLSSLVTGDGGDRGRGDPQQSVVQSLQVAHLQQKMHAVVDSLTADLAAVDKDITAREQQANSLARQMGGPVGGKVQTCTSALPRMPVLAGLGPVYVDPVALPSKAMGNLAVAVQVAERRQHIKVLQMEAQAIQHQISTLNKQQRALKSRNNHGSPGPRADDDHDMPSVHSMHSSCPSSAPHSTSNSAPAGGGVPLTASSPSLTSALSPSEHNAQHPTPAAGSDAAAQLERDQQMQALQKRCNAQHRELQALRLQMTAWMKGQQSSGPLLPTSGSDVDCLTTLDAAVKTLMPGFLVPGNDAACEAMGPPVTNPHSVMSPIMLLDDAPMAEPHQFPFRPLCGQCLSQGVVSALCDTCTTTYLKDDQQNPIPCLCFHCQSSLDTSLVMPFPRDPTPPITPDTSPPLSPQPPSRTISPTPVEQPTEMSAGGSKLADLPATGSQAKRDADDYTPDFMPIKPPPFPHWLRAPGPHWMPDKHCGRVLCDADSPERLLTIKELGIAMRSVSTVEHESLALISELPAMESDVAAVRLCDTCWFHDQHLLCPPASPLGPSKVVTPNINSVLEGA